MFAPRPTAPLSGPKAPEIAVAIHGNDRAVPRADDPRPVVPAQIDPATLRVPHLLAADHEMHRAAHIPNPPMGKGCADRVRLDVALPHSSDRVVRKLEEPLVSRGARFP